MRISRLWWLASLLGGCSDAADPAPPPPEFAVSPAAQWAGGTVLVRSRFFDGLDSLPPVTAAGVEMATVRVDDSTVAATLPTLSTQSAAVEVIDGTTHYPVGAVGVVGFRTHWIANPVAFGNPVLIKATGGPLGFAGLWPQPSGGAVGIVALDQQRVILAPGVQPVDVNALRGVGVTYDSSRYILRDGAGTIAEWRLIPGPTLVDTVPSFLQSPLARTIIRLSEGVWLNTHNHVTDVIRSGAPTISIQIEDPWAYTLSVPADRAVVSGAYGGAAMVFRMSTGDTLYRIPITTVGGAAFTSDGSTLYAISGSFSGTEQILVVNAGTGVVTDQAETPPGSFVLGLALAAAESRILIAVQNGAVPEILIYDIGSMNLVGHLVAPDSTGGNIPGWLDAAIVADDVTSVIYVMGAGGNIWEFDMLP